MNRLFFILVFAATLIACSSKKQQADVRQESVQIYSKPYFQDSVSFSKMKDAFTIVDKLYRDYAAKNNFPSIAYGIVVNGILVHTGSTGVSNVDSKTPATAKTLYRIASMSKSFTAMAILKLRDEGKIQLADPVSKYIPEFKNAGRLTDDAAPVTVLDLLTMSAGFPEDNPWGDRQLDDTDEELIAQISQGISWSNVPGVTFEYSNLGFALLGKIVTNVSGMPFQKYITQSILKPIGMNDSRWEYDEVPKDQLALGYQWEKESWHEIPLLHDGSYGSMGGLICSVEDFSKYIALHLSAWPPRNGEDNGPIKRSSIREMQQPWRFNGLFSNAKTRMGESCPISSAYGYGVAWRSDCNGRVRISHSGGLPGFGSDWRIFPDYGIGVVSFSNHTYGAPGPPNAITLDTLISIAGLKPRILPPSFLLNSRKQQLIKILSDWNDPSIESVFAENFFSDLPIDAWKELTKKAFDEAGKISTIGEIGPENQLRGTFTMEGEKKNLVVSFTLTPEVEAKIQELSVDIRDK